MNIDFNISLHHTAQLIIQLAVLIIAAWGAASVMNKFKLPLVIGYIIIGIIIGPFLLGKIPIGEIFPNGVFPFFQNGQISRFHIHEFASIASVLLLFHAGLETDVNLFIRYALKGSIIGFGEITLSFFGGYYVGTLFFPDLSPLSSTYLFMGTVATATSVSITSSILSHKKKITSPEGVTMLAAAVLDDVMGVVILAIVSGIAAMTSIENAQTSFAQISIVGLKAISIWLLSTAVGIIFAKRFGRGLKKIVGNASQISILVIGIALLMGGLFESFGLSMIIGSYIIGLTLSNTDLSFVIQEKIAPILALFVPLFFVMSGMSINILELVKPEILLFGLVYSFVGMVSKFIGAGIPALLTGFTPIGAARIGCGMMPRGAVALIIGSIGLANAYITQTAYNAIMMMIILNSILAPLILNALLSNPLKGTKHEETSNISKTKIQFKHTHLAEFIVTNFLDVMKDEEFFITKIGPKDKITYHIRKDTVFIDCQYQRDTGELFFFSDPQEINFIKTALYEAINNVAESSRLIQSDIKNNFFITDNTNEEIKDNNISLQHYISPNLVNLNLKSSTKTGIIKELIEPLSHTDCLHNTQQFTDDVLKREKTFSTGLQHGIALPHARSKSCKKTKVVIGIKKEGVNFESLDKKASTIFILIATPAHTPHLFVMTKISSLLNNPTFREKLLSCKTEQEVVDLFLQ